MRRTALTSRLFFGLVVLVLPLSNSLSFGLDIRGSFYDASQENSPGIILLHGWVGTGENWKTLSSRLQNQGYAVCALDLPQGTEHEMIKTVDDGFNDAGLVTCGQSSN